MGWSSPSNRPLLHHANTRRGDHFRLLLRSLIQARSKRYTRLAASLRPSPVCLSLRVAPSCIGTHTSYTGLYNVAHYVGALGHRSAPGVPMSTDVAYMRANVMPVSSMHSNALHLNEASIRTRWPSPPSELKTLSVISMFLPCFSIGVDFSFSSLFIFPSLSNTLENHR